MNEYADSIHVCQSMQLTASAVLDDLTGNPDALNIPAYRELVERVYMAARQAACLARKLDDAETAKFTDHVCEQLTKLAKL
ncbi:MAG: hypothetical protein IIZ93_00515 [Acidaminococcaceae bacterium]|nr:hypothetical protein [Acidaminococcaceae bacterium]